MVAAHVLVWYESQVVDECEVCSGSAATSAGWFTGSQSRLGVRTKASTSLKVQTSSGLYGAFLSSSFGVSHKVSLTGAD